ncbi:biotin synthase [Pyrodictium delaneyi]|uniref:Elp3/MiaA/NifB-like radical SAM core domain-containing protein n=1 Tax=Pyrodictium delaneyi TaxID=1273541 RepID=A0A211YLJ0_9CREN|nr:biotin synthase [Pyrodictium delaneyi]OWJ53804.1 hypothetical protein Pdsh_10215 [Pyrodictium delaneyi]
MTRLKAFRMIRRFTEVSLTGASCPLNCSHCRGRYLKGMTPVPSGPRGLLQLLEKLSQRGVRGVLVSGGLRPDGRLPLELYLDQLREARKRLGLVINLHPGYEDRPRVLEQLRDAVNVLDYELSLSPEMIKGVRRLPFSPEHTVKVMEAMMEHGHDVVPHIFLWHPWSSPELLKKELTIAADLGAKRATLLVYIPPPGEPQPPAEKLVELLRLARSLWPGELALGCMRPYSVKPILDRAAVEEGLVDRIANPSPRALREARVEPTLYDACCSLPENLLSRFRVK